MTKTDYAEPAATLPASRMPLLGFGTWQISNRDAVEATGHALEAGYRHIDTATAYGNEAGIGKALASVGLARESLFVTTKLPPAHGFVVIPKSVRPERIVPNAAGARIELTPDEVAAIDRLSESTSAS